MDGANRDPRFERQFAAKTRVPLGRYPIPDGSSLRAVECVHCGRPLGVSTWDYLNGFLVVCPHCRGYHGKPWGLERTLLAGFFFNVASFFLTMRPRHALATLSVFAVACWLLVTLAAEDDTNTGYMIASVGTFVLGPMVVNAVVLVRHQMRLDAAPPAKDGSRQV